MNKILKILNAAILIGGVYSCNGKNSGKPQTVNVQDTSVTRKNSTSTTAKQQADSSDIDCDYYVDQTEADTMIAKYTSDFNAAGHTREFWIEKCLLSSIFDYLSAHEGYDGVRLSLSAVRTGSAYRSKLQIILTTPVRTPTETDRHTNQPGITIPLPSCAPRDIHMNLGVTEALNRINNFGSEFRGERTRGNRNSATIDQLSISVWISKCKIEKLMALLNDVSKNLDGVMAIAAAYYQDDQRRQDGYRKYVVQSTLILVPTTSGRPNWEVVEPPAKWAFSGGFNHGELCPTICD